MIRPVDLHDPDDPRLLVAVPNVSEGRDPAVVSAIGDAYVAGGGGAVRLLDVHADPDHHRAVHTLVGRPGALTDALVAGARVAIERIDLRTPRGTHPHVGALDVCPIVHLDDARRGLASLEALAVAHRLGGLGLPVLLYGALAGGRPRSALRRGGIAGLTARMAAGAGHATSREAVDGASEAPDPLRPEFGPDRPHPTAGAVLVGARPPLLAFNVELAAPADLDVARRIATRIREGGPDGLPGVRAIGLELDRPDGLAGDADRRRPTPIAQVSCNVEDHRAVPLARLVAAVAAQAPVAACEVVGLPPSAAFDGFPADLPVRGRRTLEAAVSARVG